jgi:hypothetical protein
MRIGSLAAAALALLLTAGAAGAAGETAISGDYVEARTCNVWIGSCFANGEMHLAGKNAVLAWSVGKGSWNGVALDGLKVVAVLNAEGTLQTKYEGRVGAIVFVDDTARCDQRKALVAMAKALAPEHLKNVAKVEMKAIEISRKGLDATVKVESEVALKTTAICKCESTGCAAYRFYPAVSGGTEVECAKAVEHAYKGADLAGIRWSDPDQQSAMVGTFSK